MDVKELVANMTLEEKAGLCSGQDFWHTKAVERLQIPAMMVSDGPHGLRKQDESGDHLGINESIKAVCFPAGCATAASFDRELLYKVGETLGKECQAEGVGVILGPAVNIKRSPLCGRNFEYFSEDPYLASEIAASQIKGVQSKNVGTSIKHFLANNQEHRRMTSSSEVDERTLREIYLGAFEGAVTQAKPWTVMCSYNKINGTYAAENKTYLTEVLRNEWGFDGFVVSDWGAVNDRVPDLEAGLDLEMPTSFGLNDKKIVEAVKTGTLAEDVLDQAVERILNIVYRFEENRDATAVFDREADHALARKVASECMVLLKNDGILPLTEERKAAFIGVFAEKPRYQGGGSSHINASQTESALEMAAGYPVVYAKGYDTKEDQVDEELVAEAVRVAKEAEVAVIFAGLPDAFESEGYDRQHMRLPECQDRLIREIAEVQPNTIVVLHNGSPVEMPWKDDVKGLLEAYLGGQAGGSAVVNILYGKVNPSGKLAETLPLKLSDNPSYLNFAEREKVNYSEGVFVGYRYYDAKEMEVAFPFGHGLSYTTFKYSNLKLDRTEMTDQDTLTVSVDVTNTGSRAGKEVVQLYVSDRTGSVRRPLKELKGYEKVSLDPGETKTVTMTLDKRSFAWYSTELHDWYAASGEYEILIGASSRDIRLTVEIRLDSTQKLPLNLTLNTPLGDLIADERTREFGLSLQQKMDEFFYGAAGSTDKLSDDDSDEDPMADAIAASIPIRNAVSFGLMEKEELLKKLNAFNAE